MEMPTPGQAEQMPLSPYLSRKKYAWIISKLLVIPANVRPPFSSRMAGSKVAHEQSSCFVDTALERGQNYSDTDSDKFCTFGQILHMNSSASGLTAAISPASSSPKLHSHRFSRRSILSNKTITDGKSLALESNQCMVLSVFLIIIWFQLGDHF